MLARDLSVLNLEGVQTVSAALQDERAAASSRAAKRARAALHGIVNGGGGWGDDLEAGMARSLTLKQSHRLSLAGADFGLGEQGNALAVQLASAAFSLDSWFVGGASYLRTNAQARGAVWAYLLLLHLWVAFVYLMHFSGPPLVDTMRI